MARRCALIPIVLLVPLAALAPAGCGWLPPDSPPAKPVPPDPDAAAFHDWKVTGHLLGPHALISDLDAAGFDGRTVAISPTGYSSPWSGSCVEARREKQPRTLAQIAEHLQLPSDRTEHLALGEPITEYQLSCTTGRAPSLITYVGGGHAVTCWGGVCYLLAR